MATDCLFSPRKNRFARDPDSDIWVSVQDLPDATRDAIWERFKNTEGAILRIGIDADGQLRMTGFPPDCKRSVGDGEWQGHATGWRTGISSSEMAKEISIRWSFVKKPI